MFRYLHPRGIVTFRQAADPYVASTAKPVRNFELRTSGRNVLSFPTWRAGTAAASGDLTPAAGAATVSFSGASSAQGGISGADGVSVAAFAGKTNAAGSMSAGGSASVSFTGSTIATASVTPIAGTSTAQFSSGTAAFITPAPSTSVVTFSGSTQAAGDLTPSAGSTSVSFQGSSQAAGAMAPAGGSSSASFTGLVSGGPGGGTADPADVWAFVLPNGKTAAQTMVETHTMLSELYRIHGLQIGEPLIVDNLRRTAGSIEQSINQVGNVVTVARE